MCVVLGTADTIRLFFIFFFPNSGTLFISVTLSVRKSVSLFPLKQMEMHVIRSSTANIAVDGFGSDEDEGYAQ